MHHIHPPVSPCPLTPIHNTQTLIHNAIVISVHSSCSDFAAPWISRVLLRVNPWPPGGAGSEQISQFLAMYSQHLYRWIGVGRNGYRNCISLYWCTMHYAMYVRICVLYTPTHNTQTLTHNAIVVSVHSSSSCFAAPRVCRVFRRANPRPAGAGEGS